METTFTIRNQIAIHICDTYFDGSRSLKGKIIKDISSLKEDYLQKVKAILIEQQDYLLDAVSEKQKANGFNTPYGKFRYLYAIAGRLIREG